MSINFHRITPAEDAFRRMAIEAMRDASGAIEARDYAKALRLVAESSKNLIFAAATEAQDIHDQAVALE